MGAARLALVVGLAGIGFAATTAAAGVKPPRAAAPPPAIVVTAGACDADTEIPAARRKEAETSARAFWQEVLSGSPTKVWGSGTRESQSVTGLPALAELVRQIRLRGPYDNLRVEHVYMVESAETGQGGFHPVPCREPGKSGGTAYAQHAPVARQYHVFLRADGPSFGWRISVWLVSIDGALQVEGWHVSTATIAGRDSKRFLDLALAQKAKGHEMMAALMYASAQGAAGMGRAFQSPEQQAIRLRAAEFKAPAEFLGPAPWPWALGGKAYLVTGINMVGWKGRMTMVISHRPQSWDGVDDAAGDRANRELGDAFVKAHPEWSEVFDVIVVQALTPDGLHRYGSAIDKDKGWLDGSAFKGDQESPLGRGP